MNRHAERTEKGKSQAIANNFPKQWGKNSHSLQLARNRPGDARQKLQKSANNSLGIKQLTAIQTMANNNLGVDQITQLRPAVRSRGPFPFYPISVENPALITGNKTQAKELNNLASPLLKPIQRRTGRPAGHVFPLPEPKFSSGAGLNKKPVQRLQIRETPTSYLQGNPPSKENIRAYFYEYEIPLMVQRVNEYVHNEHSIGIVNALYTAYKTNYARNAGSSAGNWPLVADVLTALVRNINIALTDLVGPPSGYEAADNENWGSVQHAVEATNNLTDPGLGHTAPQGNGLAVIKTVPWSSVKSNFPPTLFRLIRDIFGSWRGGQPMDERSPAEQGNRTLNSDTPGALRSWHMNTSHTLPPNAAAPTPANAVNLENHYQNTSGVMNALGIAGPAGPIGFAEYTGTGILNDAHNSKIILDYRQGHIYLTLTHYQFWTNDHDNFQTEGQAAGTNNPWFRIDMNS
jgi:hypothetical protein